MDNFKPSSVKDKGKEPVKINIDVWQGVITPQIMKGKALSFRKMPLRFSRYRQVDPIFVTGKVILGFSSLMALILLTVYCVNLIENSGGLKMKRMCYASKDNVGLTMEEHLGRMIVALAKYAKNSDDEIKVINHFSNPGYKIPIHTMNNVNFYVVGNYSTVGCTAKFCKGPFEVLDRVFSGIETDSCEKILDQARNALRNSEVPSVLKAYIYAVQKFNKENEETVCNLLTKNIRRLRIFYDIESRNPSGEGQVASPTTNAIVEETPSKEIEQASNQNPTTVEPSTESANVMKPLKEKIDHGKGASNGINGKPNIGFSLKGQIPREPEKVKKLSSLFAELRELIEGNPFDDLDLGVIVRDQDIPMEPINQITNQVSSKTGSQATDQKKLTPMADQGKPISNEPTVEAKIESNTHGGIGELNTMIPTEDTSYKSLGLTPSSPMMFTMTQHDAMRREVVNNITKAYSS